MFRGAFHFLHHGEEHHYSTASFERRMPRDTGIDFHHTAIDLTDIEKRLAIVKHVLRGVQGQPALWKMLQEGA
jgi:hypothetical protein